LTREEYDFSLQVRKRRIVSSGSHPLFVGNLKNAFADFEILKDKAVLATLSNK